MKTHFTRFAYCFLFVFAVASCNNSDPTDPSANDQALAEKEMELKEKQKQIDELEKELEVESSTLPPEVPEPVKDEGDLSGKHNLTLQWISWNAPGKVTFTPTGKDEYRITGEQIGSKSNEECPECYLHIQGTIVKISPKVLRFTGFIESSVYHIQNGEPCIKEGTFDFVATGNRKYWRCQNMEGCDGVTDYVDIYFK